MERKSYHTDVSDAEWEIHQSFMLPEKQHWNPRLYPWREILSGIFYVTRTGCQWRILPQDLHIWWIVYFYFRLRLRDTHRNDQE